VKEYHNTPEDMVRCLTAYMDNDEAIQREVEVAFVTAPPLTVIRKIRSARDYQAGMLKAWRDRRPLQGIADNDARYQRQMAEASAAFADRLIAHGWHA
jgi:hypothetical protein